nr:transcription factor cwo isoform X2 [Danaus plexippus plexippus]
METRHYWEENGHAVKYDNYSNEEFAREPLSFAPPSEDEAEYPPGYKKGKVSRQDPMSHRIIEKRRRDRMNNCLADLSRLIPPEYLKKGRGRVEKTEIIEMAIRHLKYLQDRVHVLERGSEFLAGYQRAGAEAVRFVELQGSRDGLADQLAAHLHSHADMMAKEAVHEKRVYPNSSSETTSSSSSSQGFAVKVIQRPEPPPAFPEPYEPDRQEHFADCERLSVHQPAVMEPLEGEPLPLDGRVKKEVTLRKIRKPEHEDYLHSYKFKNSIERRFSRSQDSEGDAWSAGPTAKAYNHKRRRPTKPAPPSTSTSASGSTEEARDTSPQDTCSDSPHHHSFDKPPPPAQYVPVFALNALGKYYVPLSVEYGCVSRQLGAGVTSLEAAEARALHPVTIHVNFQPCIDYLKREPDPHWRPL